MKQEFHDLKLKLQNDLAENQAIENASARLNASLATIDKALLHLRTYVQRTPFSTQAEEIYFFKYIKPEFTALRIERILQFNLILNRPIATNEVQLNYFTEELKALELFFRANAFHYQYYKNGVAEMDDLYFLRNAGSMSLTADALDMDPDFTTPISHLFTKFIAYEHMQYFILEQVADLQYPDSLMAKSPENASGQLQWTGDTINLVELAYGLWLTGQLNDGNASLNQIVRWMETNLGANIGIAQRKFSEIGRRKRISITKYLDQMKDAILRKIDTDQY